MKGELKVIWKGALERKVKDISGDARELRKHSGKFMRTLVNEEFSLISLGFVLILNGGCYPILSCPYLIHLPTCPAKSFLTNEKRNIDFNTNVLLRKISPSIEICEDSGAPEIAHNKQKTEKINNHKNKKLSVRLVV